MNYLPALKTSKMRTLCDMSHFFQNKLPFISSQHLINRLYPHQLIVGQEGQTAVTDTLKVNFKRHEQHFQSKPRSKRDIWNSVVRYSFSFCAWFPIL